MHYIRRGEWAGVIGGSTPLARTSMPNEDVVVGMPDLVLVHVIAKAALGDDKDLRAAGARE